MFSQLPEHLGLGGLIGQSGKFAKMRRLGDEQCDQIGLFLNVFGNTLTQAAQIFDNFWELLKMSL